MGVFAITLGSMVCNKLRQPQNYIEAVDPDSVEMKTAELLSGIDGIMMFRYNSKDTFQALYVYLSEYHSGQRVSHKKVLELSKRRGCHVICFDSVASFLAFGFLRAL